jgi:hypothetical protein
MNIAIVKDIVEFKLFMKFYDLLPEAEKNRLELCSTMEVDEAEFPLSSVKLPIPALSLKILYFLAIQRWLFCNTGCSNSALQIFIYNIFVLPWNLGKKVKQNRFIFKLLRRIYQFRPLKYFSNKKVFDTNILIKKVREHADINSSQYDTVYVFRHYSLDVGLLVESLRKSNPETRIVTFCRSDDTPDTKGPPTFVSSEIIFQNEFQESRYRLLNGPSWEYQASKILDLDLMQHQAQRGERVGKFNVLYAASDAFWNPFEEELVASLAGVFRNKASLTVRPMMMDVRNWEKFNVKTDTSSYSLPLGSCSIKRFNEHLSSYDLVLSSTSTIVTEARILGVPSALVWFEGMEWVFEREHLKKIVDIGVPLVTSVGDLKNYIKKPLQGAKNETIV